MRDNLEYMGSKLRRSNRRVGSKDPSERKQVGKFELRNIRQNLDKVTELGAYYYGTDVCTDG